MDYGFTHAAEYYGNLSRVAMRFYVQTGNPGELRAAYWYARYAARVVDGGVLPC